MAEGLSMVTAMAAAALVARIPDSAAQRAEDAAQEAEAAAAEAATHNYGISVSGTTLVITEPTE